MPKGGAKDVHVGLIAIKPGDGAVVAMYGGADFQKTQFNSATEAIMQAGSTFKPFALIARPAGQHQHQDASSTATAPELRRVRGLTQRRGVQLGQGRNFAGEQFGNIDLRRRPATRSTPSSSSSTTRSAPAKTREAAIAAGMPAKGLDDNHANVLGTALAARHRHGQRLRDDRGAGRAGTPYFIEKRHVGPGDFNYKAKPQTKRGLRQGRHGRRHRRDDLRRQGRGTGDEAAQNLGRPVAGKTGTSTDSKSAWFAGFIPQLATSVGMYKPDENGNPQTSIDQAPGSASSPVARSRLRIWTTS